MLSVKSATKNIKINQVDESVFSRKYFAHCLDYALCSDICCSYGCEIDGAERDKILTYAAELEAKLRIPASQWFEDKITKDADYPSGEAMRTKVSHGSCVFHDHRLRGCSLHRFASEQGIDWHLLKPMVCSLFPVTWERGRLVTSGFLDELPCKDKGVSVFEAQKNELRVYFGDGFVSELEGIAAQTTGVKIAPLNLLT
jgi:Fe-S-cluster containining protein